MGETSEKKQLYFVPAEDTRSYCEMGENSWVAVFYIFFQKAKDTVSKQYSKMLQVHDKKPGKITFTSP